LVPSFSVAKSVTSILVGCAIADGSIQSVEQPVTDFVPELKDRGFDKVTIRHLLQQTSGLRFSESYINPFGGAAAFYYSTDLRTKTKRLRLKRPPGEDFEYTSGNTQILGLVLERAIKNKTITQYAQEKLWTPLGAEYLASWSIDRKKNGIEKTFCCINAAARDYTKIGRLYRDGGRWNSTQLVPETWVRESTTPDTTAGGVPYYKYQWWLPTPHRGDFVAQGHLGQYIYVHPANTIVIVRLGRREGKVPWVQAMRGLAEAYGAPPGSAGK
jgi:CubicO group peptidase (beta-lactamase class C family)